MWVPFLRPFPGNEAHKLFSGGPKSGVLGGGQKVYVEKVYVLFRSPRNAWKARLKGPPGQFLVGVACAGVYGLVHFVVKLFSCRSLAVQLGTPRPVFTPMCV